MREAVLWKGGSEAGNKVVEGSPGSTFRLTRACVPHFRERGYGRVVNVTSYTGLHGNIGQPAYAAAKAGVQGITAPLAIELGRFNITVNAFAPGSLSTAMTNSTPARTGFRPQA